MIPDPVTIITAA